MTTRNTNAHFELAPQAEIERSTMQRDFNVKTAFNVGELIPFYVDEVLPGDTFEIETSKVARLQTLIAPVMDNLYLDTYYFYVPNRLVWKHWQEFCGENDTVGSYWMQPVNYSIPQIKFPSNGWDVGTLADYMGLPVTGAYAGVAKTWTDVSVNALPFRAYCQIVNDWFRDENLQSPLSFYDDETVVQGANSAAINQPERCSIGAEVFHVNKYHDYFTSCLPAPQKGVNVRFLDSSVILPVKTSNVENDFGSGSIPYLKWLTNSGGSFAGKRPLVVENGNTKVMADDSSIVTNNYVIPSNLYAPFGQTARYENGQLVYTDAANINQLRQAFQIQRMLEKDARGGTRYIEILKTHFGVTSPDARLQRAEYLGGNRIPLNIEQVINTTGNQDLNLVPGETSGWSQTNDVHFDVQKSFVEHGYVIGLVCARYDHSYQEGVERFWSRKSRYDFYWPALAHLGEQAVYKSEIACFDKNSFTNVFGYQEAWADYRYKPNQITGNMRTFANKSLDIWHFADNYNQEPVLSYSWIPEDYHNVNRALVVQGDELPNGERQIFIDILVKNKCTRPMPLYSIPGLIDHF